MQHLRRVVGIHGRVHLKCFEEEDTIGSVQHDTSEYLVIAPSAIDSKEHLPSLTQIFKFDEMAGNIARKNPFQRLIFSAGKDSVSRVYTSFLLGCHLIMSHDVETEEVYSAFRRIHSMFTSDDTGSSVRSGWLAVSRAKKNGWIDFKKAPINPNSIAMDEYVRHARYPDLSSALRMTR